VLVNSLQVLPILTTYWIGFFRVGFVALIVAPTVAAILEEIPITMQPSSWFAPVSYLTLTFVFGLMLLAWRVATGGYHLASRETP
jgi:hypothetical protein